MKSYILACVVLFVLFAAFWGGCSMIFSLSPELKQKIEQERAHDEKYGSDSMAYIKSQRFVKKRLRSPGTAKFPWLDYRVQENPPGTYRVSGYCDTQNALGATVRIEYSCTMKYAGNNQWQCSNLIVNQR